jgi:Ca-activated chloride channel family protein
MCACAYQNNKQATTEVEKAETPRKVKISGSQIVSDQSLDLKRRSAPEDRMPTISRGVVASSFAKVDRELYQVLSDNSIVRVDEQPVSTFSIDVDTGSYTNVRRMLNQGIFPQKNAVRVEEFINYFEYQYPVPSNKEQPFSVVTELADSPWNADKQLLMIGLKGYAQPENELPPSNLVFLVDVSGSMSAPDKLPLVKQSLHLLTDQLSAQDHISLVTYAGTTRVVLGSTPGLDKTTIHQAIDSLNSGGTTAGAAGITLAYQEAQKAYSKEANNRVILLTDGDFNVGMSNTDELKAMVARKRDSGIFLTTIGFGRGNYNEQMMEQIADIGNGNYLYIDSFKEAHRAFVRGVKSTLFAIAKDVKIQVEFNPALVEEYRLVGYENRLMKREDFNNDKVDAGDIGQGHSVTAIYEIALTGHGSSDPLRYSDNTKPSLHSAELAFVKLRYKPLQQSSSQLITMPIKLSEKVMEPSDNMKLAIASAGFAQIIRQSPFITSEWGYNNVRQLIQSLTHNNAETLELAKLSELAEALEKP